MTTSPWAINVETELLDELGRVGGMLTEPAAGELTFWRLGAGGAGAISSSWAVSLRSGCSLSVGGSEMATPKHPPGPPMDLAGRPQRPLKSPAGFLMAVASRYRRML